MRELVIWYVSLTVRMRIVLEGVAAASLFVAGAIARSWISTIVQQQPGAIAVSYLIGFVIVMGLAVVVFRYARVVRAELDEERKTREHAFTAAYTAMDHVVARQIERVRTCSSTERFYSALVASPESLQAIVDAAYNTFEGAFGQFVPGSDRIDFEVTFMTKSYNDGGITIPACANRERRAPRSMLSRKNNPTLYDRTVTAQVYREPRPLVHIIEDTARDNYNAVYPNQTARIKSSVVMPVLSDCNELLGTLVVHCDRVRFFTRDDERYWSDVLEVFAKRLALIKARLDALVRLAGEQPPEVPGAATYF
jgi:GAF domain-containing protein